VVRLLSRPDPVGVHDEQGSSWSSVTSVASTHPSTSALITGDAVKGALLSLQTGARDGAGEGMLAEEPSNFLEDDPYADSKQQVGSQWDSTLLLPKIDEIRQNDLILDLNSVGGHDISGKLILLLRVHRVLSSSPPSPGRKAERARGMSAPTLRTASFAVRVGVRARCCAYTSSCPRWMFSR